ncbi:unnamed protein product, partial [Meganyctiphanes norvegica]
FRFAMSCLRFAEQTWPELLSEGCKDYTPEASHLFPMITVKRLTQKEIDKALKGIHPVPTGKEAITIIGNNLRRSLNENNENHLNDEADIPAVARTSLHNTDEMPDDPFIEPSDIDNIDSDGSDLPDLSNPAGKKERKSEKKEKKSDKKHFNDQDKREKKHKTSGKVDKIRIDENGKSEKRSNEMMNFNDKYKGEKKNKTDENVRPEKKSNEMIISNDQYKGEKKHKSSDISKSEKKSNEIIKSKDGEKYNDRNKINHKDRMKNRKSSSDKRESDIDRKEKDKTQSKISENKNQSYSSTKQREKEKVNSLDDLRKSDKNSSDKISNIKSNSSSKDLSSSSTKSSTLNTSDKSVTENSSSKVNSCSAPSAKPNLLSFLAKTREVKKQQSLTQEQNVLSDDQFKTPVFIKSEPEEIPNQSESVTFQAPPGYNKTSSISVPTISAPLPKGKTNSQMLSIAELPDDGDFDSHIDSDQETVTFGDTPEKTIDEEINKKENRNSTKKELKKGFDSIEKRRISDISEDKDRNKRKRDSSNIKENKRWKGCDSDKKDERHEDIKDREDSKSEAQSSHVVSRNNPSQKLLTDAASKLKPEVKKVLEKEGTNLPPFAAIPTREAEKPACRPTVFKPLSVASAATPIVSSPVTNPVIRPSAATSETAKSASSSIKIIGIKIAEMFKSISKKRTTESKLKNEREEIKRKILQIESQIQEVQREEEKNMSEIDYLQRQLLEDNDEDKLDEILQRLDVVTASHEKTEKKINLEEDKRKLVAEISTIEKNLQNTEAMRKLDESEMASLRASLSKSRLNEGSSSPRPEEVITNNSQQVG